MMLVRVKRLHEKARAPAYKTDGAACFDFVAVEPQTVPSGSAALVRTGLAFEVPAGYFMALYLRSSLARCGFTAPTGIVDSDYRGEVMFCIQNGSGERLTIEPGDRIGQGLILPHPRVEFEFAEQLTATARGTGGFGSTGR